MLNVNHQGVTVRTVCALFFSITYVQYTYVIMSYVDLILRQKTNNYKLRCLETDDFTCIYKKTYSG